MTTPPDILADLQTAVETLQANPSEVWLRTVAFVLNDISARLVEAAAKAEASTATPA